MPTLTRAPAYEALAAIIEAGVAHGVFRWPGCRASSLKAMIWMANWTPRWFRFDGDLGAVDLADTFTDTFADTFLHGVPQQDFTARASPTTTGRLPPRPPERSDNGSIAPCFIKKRTRSRQVLRSSPELTGQSVQVGSRPLVRVATDLPFARSTLQPWSDVVPPGQDTARRTRRLSFEVERPRSRRSDVRCDARKIQGNALNRFSPKHGDRKGSPYGRHCA